jgi:hypothetical protein
MATRSLTVRLRRYRFGGLFCALLLTLTGHAFFTTLPLGAKPSEWLLAVSLAAILLASEARPRALMVLGAVLAFARLPQSLILSGGVRALHGGASEATPQSALLVAVTARRSLGRGRASASASRARPRAGPGARGR